MKRELVNERNSDEKWQACVDFHGHACGGLAIGFQAARLAAENLALQYSVDEEICCISENDACGVDAISVLLGCSAGKGNLFFHLHGKQAFTFYNRETKQGLRLLLKPMPGMPREERQAWLLCQKPADLFTVQEPKLALPEKASIYQNITCTACGESAAEPFIRLQQGKPYCLACYQTPKEVKQKVVPLHHD